MWTRRRMIGAIGALAAGPIAHGAAEPFASQAAEHTTPHAAANFIDLRSYDGPSHIECDVCIAGAGAAGITLARELTGQGLSVVVLESGGHDIDGATQFLYHATNTGMRYFDLTTCRLRYFGGTSNHWGGHTNFNSELDFDGIPELGLPRWAFGRDELLPYCERAAGMLGLDFSGYDAAHSVRALGHDPSELVERHSERLDTTSFLQTGRKRFASSFASDLAHSDTRIFLYANVTHIQLTENGTEVDHVVVKTLEGKTFNVSASAHVLACHAIENARLLMVSNDVQSAGIGNDSDQLGRNFMDHVYIESGQILSSEMLMPLFYLNRLYQRGDSAPPNGTGHVISVTDETRRREEMLSYYLNFEVVYADEDVYRSLSHLKESFLEPFDGEVAEALGDVVSDLGAASRIAQEEAGGKSRKVGFLRLHQRIDQAPNPDSRITLTDERDALGLPKINLHWDITDLDVHTFQRGQQIMVEELSALGFGRFAVEEVTEDLVRENLGGHYHHMGTTRMSASASDGVVDANCQVHGVHNLYVAGSSTFPTGGRTGPTFSIVAMAIRLADHVKGKLALT